jgi:hypothetical protein
MAKRLPGEYSKSTKKQNRATIKAQLKADMKSGKMKMTKNEVPFGPGGIAKAAAKAVEGVAPAAARFAKRTGRRIIQDRKGAQVLNEKAVQERKISRVAARREAERAAGPKAKGPAGTTRAGDGSIRARVPKPRPEEFPKKYRPKVNGPVVIERVGTGKNPAKVKALKQAKIDKATAEKTARREAIFGKKTTTIKRADKGLTSGAKKRIARLESDINKGSKEFKAARARQKDLAEKRKVNYKDPTEVKQTDSAGRTIGKTTKGELAQLGAKTKRAASDARNSQFGRAQDTIAKREIAAVKKEGEVIELKSGRNVESVMTKQELKDSLDASRRASAGLKNIKGKASETKIRFKEKDLPNSKAIGEAARKRPGLAKRKAASIAESRSRANAAMNKRGLTPAQKKTLVMKSRAKARKIVEGTK